MPLLAQNQTQQIDPKQKLKAKPVKHAPKGTIEIQWHLSEKSKSGGYIVQEITTTTIFGMPAYHYWEAWEVPKGSKGTIYNEEGASYDDMFGDPSGTTVHGSARFYEGLQLPGSFWPHSPGTTAGILPATAIDPNLPTSDATAPVDRIWTAP